jgi:hypothetical protein
MSTRTGLANATEEIRVVLAALSAHTDIVRREELEAPKVAECLGPPCWAGRLVFQWDEDDAKRLHPTQARRSAAQDSVHPGDASKIRAGAPEASII